MADKKTEKKTEKTTVKKTDKTEKKTKAKSVLVEAAEAIGAATGKIAALAGATADKAPAPKAVRKPKLAAKNKSRLPRRQKKAEKKAAAVRLQQH
jgi:hypothetical protein